MYDNKFESYCKDCVYFSKMKGDRLISCAVHPNGPTQSMCPDYEKDLKGCPEVISISIDDVKRSIALNGYKWRTKDRRLMVMLNTIQMLDETRDIVTTEEDYKSGLLDTLVFLGGSNAFYVDEADLDSLSRIYDKYKFGKELDSGDEAIILSAALKQWQGFFADAVDDA